MKNKTIKHGFSMFHTLIKHGFLTNQSVQGPIYIIIYFESAKFRHTVL